MGEAQGMTDGKTDTGAYGRWYRSFRNDNTRDNWTRLAERYRAWRGVSWDELLEERKRTYYPDQTLPLMEAAVVKRTVEQKVGDFAMVLEKTGYSPASVRQIVKAIKSFYHVASYETMDLSLKSLRLPKGTVIDSLPPTAEEITMLLKHGSLRERAMLAFLAETGWGGELLCRAKVGDVTRGEGVPYIIVTKRGKTHERVVTFVGQRAADLLDAYLLERFGSRSNEDEAITQYLFVNHRGKPLVSKRVNETIVRLAVKGEQNKKLYRGRNSFHAYALRHFFQTTLEDAKVPENWIKTMMGHALGDVEGAYSKPRIMQMRQAYIQAYPKLLGSLGELPREPVVNDEAVQALIKAVQALSASAPAGVRQNVESLIDEVKGSMPRLRKGDRRKS